MIRKHHTGEQIRARGAKIVAPRGSFKIVGETWDAMRIEFDLLHAVLCHGYRRRGSLPSGLRRRRASCTSTTAEIEKRNGGATSTTTT